MVHILDHVWADLLAVVPWEVPAALWAAWVALPVVRAVLSGDSGAPWAVTAAVSAAWAAQADPDLLNDRSPADGLTEIVLYMLPAFAPPPLLSLAIAPDCSAYLRPETILSVQSILSLGVLATETTQNASHY